MCIEYNECHYGSMYNVYVKRIFVITEIVHMNAGVSSKSRERKRLKSLSHSHEGWHPRSTPTIGCRVRGVTYSMSVSSSSILVRSTPKLTIKELPNISKYN